MSDLVLPAPEHANCGIYSITFENGKRYIGQSVNIRSRLQYHQRGAKNGKDWPVYRAMRKHEFTFEVLCVCPADQLNAMEREHIASFNTVVPNGYNLIDGGGQQGRLHESTKQKLSIAHKGKHLSEEHKAKLRITNRRPHTDETKRVLAEKNKRCRPSELALQRAADSHRGKPLSEEVKEKIRRANTGRVTPPEVRAKISAAKKGVPKPRHLIDALAELNRGRSQSPEHIAKCAAMRLGKKKVKNVLTGERRYVSPNLIAGLLADGWQLGWM